MKVKILEIRDKMTFVPMLCVDMNPDWGWDSAHSDRQKEFSKEQRYLLRRCGYPCDGKPNISMTRLDAGGGACWNDPYGWNCSGRTFPIAHNYIINHWTELFDGDVVDVEFILGEALTKKLSER